MDYFRLPIWMRFYAIEAQRLEVVSQNVADLTLLGVGEVRPRAKAAMV